MGGESGLDLMRKVGARDATLPAAALTASGREEDRRRSLAAGMDQLSATQRQSVALAFFQGLSHAEVAVQMRQPLGTVKSWVRRSLATLKSCLDAALNNDARQASMKATA